MKQKEHVLDPNDPHINLLLDKQLKGKPAVRHVHSNDLQEILNALTPSQASYVAYQVKRGHRSLWQHVKDSWDDFLFDLPGKILPDWLASRI